MIPKIRIDDYPTGMPGKHYTTKDFKMLELLEQRQVHYLLGVTPYLISKYDMEYVLPKLKYAVIGMHGFTHAFEKWRPASEFDGMPYEECWEKMMHSLLLIDMCDKDTKIFMPPFNMFNQTLIDVLANTGFTHITCGPETKYQMDLSKIDLKGITPIWSLDDFYTSKGHFNILLNRLNTLPEGMQLTFHFGEEYDFTQQ